MMRYETSNRFQIMVLQQVSLWFGIGIFLVSIYRLYTHHYVLAASQLFFALFLLVNYYLLKRDVSYYKKYAVLFFIALFAYMIIAFFSADNNRLNIIWIVISPLFIFFFLDAKGGLMIYALLLGFIATLLIIDYPYRGIEYITLLAAISTVTFLMYGYERYKDAYVRKLRDFNIQLQEEIAKQTQTLQTVNKELEARVTHEVEKRTRHEEMLLRQHRMASLGEMMDAVAHQWRQPLMAASAQLLHLHRRAMQQRDRETIKRLDEVFTLLEHMSHTIDDFRNLVQPHKATQLVTLFDVIQETLALLKAQTKNVRIKLVTPHNARWKGCKSELIQVMIIIISNALEALHIRAVSHPKLIIQVLQQTSRLTIRIIDNAGGIDATIFPHIFDPYITTKTQQGGTGLGLYIARIIVQEHFGGTLTASNHTSGAMLTLTIPKDTSDA